jgi:hypothetical protein
VSTINGYAAIDVTEIGTENRSTWTKTASTTNLYSTKSTCPNLGPSQDRQGHLGTMSETTDQSMFYRHRLCSAMGITSIFTTIDSSHSIAAKYRNFKQIR